MDSLCYALMQNFTERYLRRKRELFVCDIGSCDVSSDGSEITFRELFARHRYTGLDIVSGNNVDVVTEDPYKYPFEDESFHVVISGSTLEHVKDLHKWILELKRILKREGLMCIIAPSVFRMNHPHPVDCWRIYPDGMRFLLEGIAGLEVLKIRRNHSKRGTVMCMGVGKRND